MENLIGNCEECIEFHRKKIEELKIKQREATELKRNILGFVSDENCYKFDENLVTEEDVQNYILLLNSKIGKNEQSILDLNVFKLEYVTIQDLLAEPEPIFQEEVKRITIDVEKPADIIKKSKHSWSRYGSSGSSVSLSSPSESSDNESNSYTRKKSYENRSITSGRVYYNSKWKTSQQNFNHQKSFKTYNHSNQGNNNIYVPNYGFSRNQRRSYKPRYERQNLIQVTPGL